MQLIKFNLRYLSSARQINRTAFDYSRTAEIRGHFKAKDALNLANYIEYIDCKDYRFHCHMRHTTGNDDSFIKAQNVRNSLLLYSLQNSSIEYASAADLKSRLIFLHLAIEDRYAMLEREGDVAGFEICMQYQDNIYLLVCPDDPEPNADIRRPLLTALTLAHYVEYEEYSAQCGIDCFYRKEPQSEEEKWQINDEKSTHCHTEFLFKSAEKIRESLTILHQQLTSRYHILQKDKDIIGCTIILQYQDKITDLLATSSK